jgi:hypothetical protein
MEIKGIALLLSEGSPVFLCGNTMVREADLRGWVDEVARKLEGGASVASDILQESCLQGETGLVARWMDVPSEQVLLAVFCSAEQRDQTKSFVDKISVYFEFVLRGQGTKLLGNNLEMETTTMDILHKQRVIPRKVYSQTSLAGAKFSSTLSRMLPFYSLSDHALLEKVRVSKGNEDLRALGPPPARAHLREPRVSELHSEHMRKIGRTNRSLAFEMKIGQKKVLSYHKGQTRGERQGQARRPPQQAQSRH